MSSENTQEIKMDKDTNDLYEFSFGTHHYDYNPQIYNHQIDKSLEPYGSITNLVRIGNLTKFTITFTAENLCKVIIDLKDKFPINIDDILKKIFNKVSINYEILKAVYDIHPGIEYLELLKSSLTSKDKNAWKTVLRLIQHYDRDHMLVKDLTINLQLCSWSKINDLIVYLFEESSFDRSSS
jgi:hypothetical protein